MTDIAVLRTHQTSAAMALPDWSQEYLDVSYIRTHFGELLQGHFVFDEIYHCAPITWPCPEYYSKARFKPNYGAPLTVNFPKHEKHLKAVLLSLKHIGRADWGGALELESKPPQSNGGKLSREDVVATIRAVASAFKTHIPDEDIVRLSVAAETASDKIMFESADNYSGCSDVSLRLRSRKCFRQTGSTLGQILFTKREV